LLAASPLPAQTQQKVTLAWDASPNSNVVDYVVYSGVRSGLYSRSLSSHGKTNLTIPGLKKGVTYFFAVTAVALGGIESDPSAELRYASPCPGKVPTLINASLLASASGLRVRIPAAPGRKYRLETSDDLLTWVPLWTSPIVSGETALEFVDAPAGSAQRRFYRTAVTGPYAELAGHLSVTPVQNPAPGAVIKFNAAAGHSYQVQATDDGLSWNSVWDSPPLSTNGSLAFFDAYPNSTQARQYRLLVAGEIAKTAGNPCGEPTLAPIISDIPTQQTYLDGPALNIPFAVSDPDTPLNVLTFSASSSNPELVPEAGMVIEGQGANRRVTVTPAPGRWGTAIIELVVSDGDKASATAFRLQVRTDLPPTFPLIVNRVGQGSFSPNLNGQQLAPGERYTIKAVPGPGQIFAGWRGDVESESATLTFVMRPQLVLEAVFVADPVAAIQGTYTGLFRETTVVRNARAGFFTVTATDRGSYSGKLTIEGKNYTLSGQLDGDLKASNTVFRAGASPLTIELAFGGGNSDQVIGRITDDVWSASLLGYRSAFNAATDPAPFAGSYTVVFPGRRVSVRNPEGSGWGTLKVDGNGAATFAGTLADGTKLSQKVRLSMAGQWPLCVPLYRGEGLLLGWHTVTNAATNGVTGAAHWIKPMMSDSKLYPAGFTNEVTTVGSRYVRPSVGNRVLDLAQTEIVFTGGNLATSFAHTIALSDKNIITAVDAGKVALKLNLLSGAFSGSVVEPSTLKPLKFSGALLQDQNAAAGFLLGTNRSARVVFGD
jgi:hypothetical protein